MHIGKLIITKTMGSSPNLLDFLNEDAPSTSSPTVNNMSTVVPVPQWCEKCYKQAQDMELRHMKSIGIIKKKIIFTDNLIGTYTQMKSSLEQSEAQVKVLEQECNRKEADNQIINKQLKAMLDDRNPTELQKQKEETKSLKMVVENLNDQIKSMEMTSRMLEDKIESLKEEQIQKEIDWKKHNKEKDLLQKDVSKLKKTIGSLKKENSALIKKNEVLQERMRRRRSRGSGSFSHTTDSEHNTTVQSDDLTKTEPEENSTIFKSPLPGKKKRIKRKKRKSLISEGSDEEESNVVNVIKPIEAVSISNNGQPESPDEDDILVQKEPDRKAKSNWLSSSSDTAADTVKPILASNDMKARLLEVKRKRAYRSFCSHPSGTQLRELSEIAERIKEDSCSLQTEAERFCSKHHLTGHESFVIRKIEKLNKNSLDRIDADSLMQTQFDSIIGSRQTQYEADVKLVEKLNEPSVPEDIDPPFCNEDNLDVTDSAQVSLSLPPRASNAECENTAEIGASVENGTGNTVGETSLVTSVTRDIAEQVLPMTSSSPGTAEKKLSIISSTLDTAPKTPPITSLSREDASETSPVTSLSREDASETSPVTTSIPKTFGEKMATTSSVLNSSDETPPITKTTGETTPMASSAETPLITSSSPVRRSSIEHIDVKAALGEFEKTETDDVIQRKVTSSVFSSSDDNDEDLVKVKIHSINCKEIVKKKVKRTNASPRIRTRSISKSLSDTTPKNDTDVSINPRSDCIAQDDKVKMAVIGDICQSTSSTRAKLISVDEFSSDSTDSDSLPLKMLQNRKRVAHVRRGSKKVARKASTATTASDKASTNASQSLKEAKSTTSNNNQMKVHKKANTDATSKLNQIPSDAAKPKPQTGAPKRKQLISSPEVVIKLSRLSDSSAVTKKHPTPATKTTDPTNSKHRVLASLQSLPFNVEGEGSLSPKCDAESYSFVPATSNLSDLSDDELSPASDKLSSSDNDIMSPTKLNNILHDMTTMMSLEPLSPLGGSELDLSSDGVFDFNPEDDNRLSISPSSDLCTAISFSSSVTKTTESSAIVAASLGVSTATIHHKTEISHQTKLLEPPCVSDAPRRFSCEAPSLARTVTVKRVCKAQSLDPSALSIGGPITTSVKDVALAAATPLSPIQSEPSSASKILPSNVKIVTPAYSGPFKVVSSSSSPISSPQEKNTQSVAAEQSLQPSTSKVSDTAQASETIATETAIIDEIPTESQCRGISRSESTLDRKTVAPHIPAPALEGHGKVSENSIGQQAIVSLSRMLQEIHRYAVVKHPAKTYSNIPFLSIVRWLTNVIKTSHVHVTHEIVSNFYSSNGDLSKLGVKDLLHEWEHKFVLMVVAVDRVRSEYQTGIIESLIVPIIMKLLCRFGNCLHSTGAFVMDDEVASQLGFSLRKGKLDVAHTCALVRLLSILCRSVGYAKGVIDFCRYAMLLTSISSVEPMIYDCIACYPEAFSGSFAKSGKILIHSLGLYAEQYKYTSKSEEFKDDIRSRVRHLEILLGWDDDENTVLLSKRKVLQVSRGEENLMMDEKWSKVFAQCMSSIGAAKLVEVNVRSQSVGSQNHSQTLALSIDDLSDVFSALELLASLKSLTFVTAEIIDKKFWPWLNAWSRHLVSNSNKEENKPVSDACVMAVLHGLAVVLSVVILRQKARHPSQVISKQVVPYFETICALLSNFARRHLKSAPYRVQCATAVTVFKLAYCNPVLAYTSLFDWFKASLVLENEDGQSNTRGGHPLLPHMIALYPEKLMRKMMAWLQSQNRATRKDQKYATTSLTTLIWG